MTAPRDDVSASPDREGAALGGADSTEPQDTPQRFGFSDQEWERMVEAGYDYLAKRAARGQISDYTSVSGEVARTAGVRVEAWQYAFHWVLGDIATKSYRDKRVLLTAVVTYRNSTEAGVGLFNIAQQLGVIDEVPPHNSVERDRLHMQWINDCFTAYGS